MPLGSIRLRALARGAAFRLLAIALGLLPLVGCELALRALDWGRPGVAPDPFVGFSAVYPLFVLDATKTRYEISPTYKRFFGPVSFPARKSAAGYRIFCLGGSSVLGHPFSVETSFTTWLQISLAAADPTRNWEVVNIGGISYAGYRLVPVMQELLRYQPDLFIVYTGHNEFLEDRTYTHVKRIPEALRGPLAAVCRLRSFALAQAALERMRPARPDGADVRPLLAHEVRALLDYRGGLEKYHRDDVWRQGVIDHFEFSLRQMVQIAQDASVPIVLVNPVSHLDMPPFKSEHRAGLSADKRQQFEALWDAARAQYGKNMPLAIELLRRAIAIDDQHAGIHYTLGKCYQQLGRNEEALAELTRAKDSDICPLRALEPMNQIVLDVARQTGAPLLDQVELYAARSPGGIVGGDWMVDHVHPSIAGHKVLANVLADLLIDQGIVHPVAGWQAERDRRYQEHYASLDSFYFLMGQKRLVNLQMWAEGRAERVPPEPPKRPAPPSRPPGG